METIRRFLKTLTLRRVVVYMAGILILACGLTMNTKTGLGVSPVLSVAYTLGELLGIPFSTMTFIYYCFLILLQLLLLGREFEQIQWLQLAASFLTSPFIGVFSRVIPAAESLPVRILLLLIAVLLTAVGIILTMGARFVPNPADGMSGAVARRTGRSLGFSKNLLDICSVFAALILGLVFRGRLIGLGLGTVITMLLTGRAVALMQKPLLRLTKLDRE